MVEIDRSRDRGRADRGVRSLRARAHRQRHSGPERHVLGRPADDALRHQRARAPLRTSRRSPSFAARAGRSTSAAPCAIAASPPSAAISASPTPNTSRPAPTGSAGRARPGSAPTRAGRSSARTSRSGCDTTAVASVATDTLPWGRHVRAIAARYGGRKSCAQSHLNRTSRGATTACSESSSADDPGWSRCSEQDRLESRSCQAMNRSSQASRNAARVGPSSLAYCSGGVVQRRTRNHEHRVSVTRPLLRTTMA